MSKAKRIEFSGYDGKTYRGLSLGTRRDALRIVYTVPGLGPVQTSLPKSEQGRVRYLAGEVR